MATSLKSVAVDQARRLFTGKPDVFTPRWGVSSETGVLTDVLLSRPDHLAVIPCNAVARRSLALGQATSRVEASQQHDAFVRMLEAEGVRCHFVSAREHSPDLCFTRDAALMTPWGLVQLRPKASHRQAEADHVVSSALTIGCSLHDRVVVGSIEGGDVCLAHEGLVIIGYSGERTDLTGAHALGSLFKQHRWRVILTPFDPEYLHLDTMMTMVRPDLALACTDALEATFLTALSQLGIEVLPITPIEVQSLSGNCVSLGQDRVIMAKGEVRIAAALRRRGVEVLEVSLDQFTHCGGGPHCLTLPLART